MTGSDKLRYGIARAVDGCFRRRDNREQQQQREVENESSKQWH